MKNELEVSSGFRNVITPLNLVKGAYNYFLSCLCTSLSSRCVSVLQLERIKMAGQESMDFQQQQVSGRGLYKVKCGVKTVEFNKALTD